MMLKNVKMPIVAGGGSGNRHSLKSALKRGFTIMELVIVIAVIAVLAAVLIPTFANLTQRANESADTQTVENLNTILRSEETITGEKPATMAEAIEVAASGGYNVDALTPTSDGNDIVWIKDVNRFALVDGDGAVIHSDDGITSLDDYDVIYKISSDIADLNDTEYGYYFREDTTVSGNITTSVSADFSAVDGIEEVTVNGNTAGTIDIALNSETADLQVNGSAATVNVYGTLGNINGENYGMNSLHVYGTVVGKVNVAAGKVVAEAGSSISTVMVTAKTYSSETLSIIIEQSGAVAAVGATNETVAGKLNDIVSGDTGKTDIADAVVSSDFAGGIGTEASPYLIATAEQFKNIKSGTADNIAYYILVNDIDLNDEIEIYHLYNAGKGVPCFYGDSAKELDYVKISGATDSGISALTMPVETEVTNYWVFLFNKISNCEFSDLIIKYNMPETSAAFSQDSCSNVTFKNVDTYGEAKLPGRNCGLYVYYADNCKFIGCDNYADIDAGADINGTIYVGVPSGGTIEFTDCNNYGTIKGQMVGMFYGNGYNAGNVTTLIANCNNFGLITSTSSQKDKSNIFGQTSKGIIKVQNNNGEFEEVDDLTAGIIQNCVRMADSQFKVEINGEDISVTKANDSNAVKYVVELGFYITSYDENGISLGTGYFVVEQEISFNEENTCVAELKYLSFVPESSDYNETDKSYVGQNDTFEAEVVVVTDADGASHYMVKLSEIQTSYDIKTEINPTCKVKTYDTNGNLLYAVIAE